MSEASATSAGRPSIVAGFTWLLLFLLAGEVTVWVAPVPLPGPVAGMVLLLAALAARGAVPEHLRTAAEALLGHLMLLLVPATAALMTHGQRLASEWLAIALAGIAGAALTMAVTATTLHLLLVWPRRPLR